MASVAVAAGRPCLECGAPMRALGTTTYCPDEDGHGKMRCACGSLNVAPFAGPWRESVHCWDCGRVMFVVDA